MQKDAELRNKLIHGSRQLGIDLSEAQSSALLKFIRLLAKWNRTYNLTAVDDVSQMLSHHLLDSLAIAPYLTASRAIDVGAGAGLPGIPLAIYFPQKEFVLLDKNGKKTRFMRQVQYAIGLTNITVIQQRTELYRPESCFAAVITRALTTLPKMLHMTADLCCNDGQFFALKGRYPQAEIAAVPKDYRIEAVHRLQIPFLDGERHLVIIGRGNET